MWVVWWKLPEAKVSYLMSLTLQLSWMDHQEFAVLFLSVRQYSTLMSQYCSGIDWFVVSESEFFIYAEAILTQLLNLSLVLQYPLLEVSIK